MTQDDTAVTKDITKRLATVSQPLVPVHSSRVLSKDCTLVNRTTCLAATHCGPLVWWSVIGREE